MSHFLTKYTPKKLTEFNKGLKTAGVMTEYMAKGADMALRVGARGLGEGMLHAVKSPYYAVQGVQALKKNFFEEGKLFHHKPEPLIGESFTKSFDETRNSYKQLSQLKREGPGPIAHLAEADKRVATTAWEKEVFHTRTNMLTSGAASLWHAPVVGTALANTAISGGIYALLAAGSDNNLDSAGDRMMNVGKNMTAGLVDAGAFTLSDWAAAGLSRLGPYGAMAGLALQGVSMATVALGVDPGSLTLNLMDSMDERYNQDRGGSKFNMTQNTSMAMQRQISNLHASGSNMAEVMHN